MSGAARRIHGRSILLQVELGHAHGVDDAALHALGLDRAALRQPDTMVPEGPVYAHLEQVAARTDVDRFVVELAELHALTSLGLVGVAARHAPTGRAAFQQFERYQHLVNELARHQLHEEGEQVVWTEYRHEREGLGAQLAAEVSVATTIHIMRQACGERFVPGFVELVREAAPSAVYRDFLGCDVVWGAPRARFAFSRALLDRPMPTSDPAALAELEHVLRGLDLQRDKDRSGAPEVVHEVRRALLPVLSRGAPPLAEVARALRVSPRTLQRRLGEASTSYAAVVEALRHELALAYLRRAELSVAEVAYLLGYRESTTFHRAFRRWTGRTPDAVRRAPVTARDTS
jgi:AraC-like DNA-binding protein